METSETFDYENLVELLCVKKGYFRDTFLSEKRRERLTEDKELLEWGQGDGKYK